MALDQSPLFKTPTHTRADEADNNSLSPEKQAVRQFLSVVSQGKTLNDSFNSSKLGELFRPSTKDSNGRSQSPYKNKNNCSFRNEQEYQEETSKVLHDEGYDDDNIKEIQSNMILYKSISAVKDYREYIKDRMRRARNSTNAKAKVNTVNTKYNSAKRSKLTSPRKDSSPLRQTQVQSPTQNTIKNSHVGTSARSQKILEIESMLLLNSKPHQYTVRPNHVISPFKSQIVETTHNEKEKSVCVESPNKLNATIDTIGCMSTTPHQQMKQANQEQVQATVFNQKEEKILNAAQALDMQTMSPISTQKQEEITVQEETIVVQKQTQFIKKQKGTQSTQAFQPAAKFIQKTETLENTQKVQPKQQAKLIETPTKPKTTMTSRKQSVTSNTQKWSSSNNTQTPSNKKEEKKITVRPESARAQITSTPITKTKKSQLIVQSGNPFSNNSACKTEIYSPTNLQTQGTSEDLLQTPKCQSSVKQIEQSPINFYHPQKEELDTGVLLAEQARLYQRKKDDTVQSLLAEFQESKLRENKPEHPDKWLQKGDSPTKRLIQMKKAAHTAHPSVKDIRGKSVTNNYSIKYVASPSKSYLVNPKEGEIDYTQAYKNFDKFYDKVSNQKIVKYKITENQEQKNANKESKWFKTPNQIEAKETTRPMMKAPITNNYSRKSSQVAIASKRI